ncbi:MAG: PhoX family phosphatase [Pseudomonadota bacterium]
MSLKEKYAPVIVEDGDDIGSNTSNNTPMVELIEKRLSRRSMIKGFAVLSATGALGGTLTSRIALAQGDGKGSSLTFDEAPHTIADDHQIAPGYDANVLIRWGDKVLADAVEFDPSAQTADQQAKQFGYNNDYVAYFPLPQGSDNSEHGILHVNHEYTISELMFPGYSEEAHTPEQSAIEMAAHGGSTIEIIKEDGAWRVVDDSPYARRITVDTAMEITGPAAGHDRMKTNADPTGTQVLGTINNCAGGKTPWGTVLMAEENFHGYFGGELPTETQDQKPVPHPEQANHDRYGVEADSRYQWFNSVGRFDRAQEPNEANRFGWMVEYDPYDANSLPKKRTGLGRFKHEGATSIVNKDGHLVVYTGDDERFDYLYKFVSGRPVDLENRAANDGLLDEGTLFVARFDEDQLTWLPLTHGEGPLTAAEGFESQADVMIETRRAADLLGATPMDRPEDVEPNPVNGRVYVMLTNNTRRTDAQTDAVNPRAENAHGHIVELVPPGGEGADADHAATEFGWNIFLMGGNPAAEGSGAMYGEGTNVWFSSPDNCAVDPQGRLWISTDQGSSQAKNNIPDGMYACDVSGDGQQIVKFFYACPRDAEMCGPEFTPDGRTLFVAPQHPGEADGSTFESPSTRWPDFAEGMPPRPAIVAITKQDGGEIGS